MAYCGALKGILERKVLENRFKKIANYTISGNLHAQLQNISNQQKSSVFVLQFFRTKIIFSNHSLTF